MEKMFGLIYIMDELVCDWDEVKERAKDLVPKPEAFELPYIEPHVEYALPTQPNGLNQRQRRKLHRQVPQLRKR